MLVAGPVKGRPGWSFPIPVDRNRPTQNPYPSGCHEDSEPLAFRKSGERLIVDQPLSPGRDSRKPGDTSS